MKPRRLPSLNALRAFEAASRHGSLTKAARELNVTPAAVSHQIKALEADVGGSLMTRSGNEFRLSPAAQSALPPLRAAFDHLAEAARRLRADESRYILTVSVGPTFASSFLVRRLAGFRELFPDIDVRLDTTDTLADFLRDGVDVGIRFGKGDYPGLHSVRLFDDEVFPVCSPSLIESAGPLETPDDLAHHTLLHTEWTPSTGETFDWQSWLLAAGAEGVDYSRGPRFTHSNLALQAAMEGQGVALGGDSLASDDLKSGRLIRPFKVALSMGFAYHLVCPEEAAGIPKVAAFRRWLLAEVQALQQSAGEKAEAPAKDEPAQEA